MLDYVFVTENRCQNGSENDLSSTRGGSDEASCFIKLSAGFGAAGLTTSWRRFSPAHAQAKQVFRLPTSSRWAIRPWCDGESRKETRGRDDGRLSVQMYPSMQLGGEKETSNRRRSARSSSCASASGRWDRSSMTQRRQHARSCSRKHGARPEMMDGPIGQGTARQRSGKPQREPVAAVLDGSGARSLYHTKRPIKSIEDVECHRPIGPIDPTLTRKKLDTPDLRLFDMVSLAAELHRRIHLYREPPIGRAASFFPSSPSPHGSG